MPRPGVGEAGEDGREEMLPGSEGTPKAEAPTCAQPPEIARAWKMGFNCKRCPWVGVSWQGGFPMRAREDEEVLTSGQSRASKIVLGARSPGLWASFIPSHSTALG